MGDRKENPALPHVIFSSIYVPNVSTKKAHSLIHHLGFNWAGAVKVQTRMEIANTGEGIVDVRSVESKQRKGKGGDGCIAVCGLLDQRS